MALTGRNAIIGWSIAATIVGMTGMSFAAVPLYRMFCSVTGYGGTPDIRSIAAPGSNGETVAVSFDADVSPGLPWVFVPDQRKILLKLGDSRVAFYHAVNRSDSTITGMALYNVTPEKVGKYFHKTACFCFNKQTLSAHQGMEFPVSFWIDPSMRTDPNTADVRVVTLSYTFFRSIEDAEKSGALAKAGPHIGSLSSISVMNKLKAN